MPFILTKTGREFLATRSKFSPRFPVIQSIVAQIGTATLNAIWSKRHNSLDFASKVVRLRWTASPLRIPRTTAKNMKFCLRRFSHFLRFLQPITDSKTSHVLLPTLCCLIQFAKANCIKNIR